MPNLNTTIIIGHLTGDPELRHIPSGSAVCEISIAVNRKTGRDHEKDETLFMPVVIWGKTAENVAKYMRKGSCMMVQGFLRQENWQAQDGSKRSAIKLVAEDVQFMGSPNRGGSSGGNPGAGSGYSGGSGYGQSQHRYSREDCPPPQRPTVDPQYGPDPSMQGPAPADDLPF